MKFLIGRPLSVYFSMLSVSLCIAQTYTFDDLTDGPLHGQHGWVCDKADAAMANFSVVDRLGTTNQKGDKALMIHGSESYMKILRDENIRPWKPGDTAVFDVDFQFGLNEGHVEEARNGLAVILGGPTLHVENRWVMSIGITPAGDWVLRGNAPHWENFAKLPAETFVARPSGESSASSDWYHMKITAKKERTPNTFNVSLMIMDAAGETVLEHHFKDEPIEGAKATLWSEESMNIAFSAKDDINGMVCVDNVVFSVIDGNSQMVGLLSY